MYDALRNGLPEDIYSTYLYNYIRIDEDAVEEILKDIDTDFIPYLNNVALHLQGAVETGGGAAVGAVPPSPASSQKPPSPRFSESPAELALRTKKHIERTLAIEENDKELELALGIKRGAQMSIAEADRQNANPNYGKSIEFGINCATCAAAFVLRLRGFDVKAKGNTERNGNVNYWLSKGHSFDIWKNVDGSPAKPRKTVDWMAENGIESMEADDYRRYFDETCREKGIYILTLNWSDGAGHATILQRDENGDLFYIEPQHYNGKTEDDRRSIEDIVHDLDSNPCFNKGILRVDDKVFDASYASLFEV